MHRLLLAAAVQPDNTPHGYVLTMAFPVIVFVIVAAVLFLRFRSPHRVPGHVALASSRWAGGTNAAAQAADPTAHATSDAETVRAEPADEGTEDSE